MIIRSELLTHESRAGDRRVVVRRDIVKAERCVERLRVAHHRQRVEPDLGILKAARFVQREPQSAAWPGRGRARRDARTAVSSRPPSRHTLRRGRLAPRAAAGRSSRAACAALLARPRTARRAAGHSRRAVPSSSASISWNARSSPIQATYSSQHPPDLGDVDGPGGPNLELSNRMHLSTVYVA